MKRTPTSKPSTFSKEQMAAAIAAAPDEVNDPECPYDPNDAAAVKAFWAKGKVVRLPGQRGPQKRPTKVAVTVRYSPEVVEFFRATGEGWQTRMNDALREYVKRHRAA
ncbi:MAG: BrnA antitoxin family protein [Rhodoferax sp.]|nr:BrnA antitoxin family protein [Rhodoferax sp.]